ncbi:hypothetical protein GCM10009642_62290 [Nocardiopsis metallicus]|uniref:Uncharacterized protein n=1 Tax=Nocardiopsis metallicus TaxID=179819 RepID=A0A840WZP9_9ACTN|nr:hypothetical protein [Nocardiopsis metallicus]
MPTDPSTLPRSPSDLVGLALILPSHEASEEVAHIRSLLTKALQENVAHTPPTQHPALTVLTPAPEGPHGQDPHPS